MSDDWTKILAAWAGSAVVAFAIYFLGGYDTFMVAIGRAVPQIEAKASPQPATVRVVTPAAAPVTETSGPIGAYASVPNPPVRPGTADPAKRSDGIASVTPAESGAANPDSDAKPAMRRQTNLPRSPVPQLFRMIPVFGGIR